MLGGVVSLLAGAFESYFGIKSGLLVLGKKLARQSSGIPFLKITAAGFDVGDKSAALEQGAGRSLNLGSRAKMLTEPHELLALNHTSVHSNSGPQTLVTDGHASIGADLDGHAHAP